MAIQKKKPAAVNQARPNVIKAGSVKKKPAAVNNHVRSTVKKADSAQKILQSQTTSHKKEACCQMEECYHTIAKVYDYSPTKRSMFIEVGGELWLVDKLWKTANHNAVQLVGKLWKDDTCIGGSGSNKQMPNVGLQIQSTECDIGSPSAEEELIYSVELQKELLSEPHLAGAFSSFAQIFNRTIIEARSMSGKARNREAYLRASAQELLEVHIKKLRQCQMEWPEIYNAFSCADEVKTKIWKEWIGYFHSKLDLDDWKATKEQRPEQGRQPEIATSQPSTQGTQVPRRTMQVAEPQPSTASHAAKSGGKKISLPHLTTEVAKTVDVICKRTMTEKASADARANELDELACKLRDVSNHRNVRQALYRAIELEVTLDEAESSQRKIGQLVRRVKDDACTHAPSHAIAKMLIDDWVDERSERSAAATQCTASSNSAGSGAKAQSAVLDILQQH